MFLNAAQLKAIGFRSIGDGVQISDKCSVYGAEHISVGDFSRIDDFCVLSAGPGGISIGRNVHIACQCTLIGKEPITLDDFSGISSHCAVYSSSDDYTGRHMTNPTVPAEFTNVKHGPISLGKHAIIGAGSIILPGVTIGDGAAVGALSLVTKHLDPFGVYIGSPAKYIKPRKRDLLNLERDYVNSHR